MYYTLSHGKRHPIKTDSLDHAALMLDKRGHEALIWTFKDTQGREIVQHMTDHALDALSRLQPTT